MSTTKARYVVAALVALHAAMVTAAEPPVPGAVRPGQIEKQFEEPPAPRASDVPAVQPPAPAQAVPAEAAAVRFVLRHVELEGATVYTEAALRPYFAALLGRDIGLGEIYALADRLTRVYRNDGYILSQVIVPEQQIVVERGVVRLRVIEGYVDRVTLEGEATGPRALLERYAERIEQSRPLRAAVLERYLLLMNDLGGMVARATLSPSQTVAGASDLLVTLTQERVHGDVGIGNRNTRALGPWRGGANLDVYSLLGRYDHTGLRAASTFDDELNFVALLHDQPVGRDGGRIGVNVSYARANPEASVNLPPDLLSESVMGGVSYTHPVVRSRTRNLYLRGGLALHDGRTDFADTRLSEDRLRALRVGATYDRADRWRGLNLIDAELGRGLDILGATESGAASLSRADGRSDYTKLNLYAARLQGIGGGWSALIAITGQYAFDPLLGAEQWAYGGDAFGRAYDASELVGDSGAAFKLEPRYTATRAQGWLRSYTAYGYYDIGKVWRRDAQDQPGSEAAAAVGVGARLTFAGGYSGYIEIAKPTTHTVQAEGDDGVRVFGGVSKRF